LPVLATTVPAAGPLLAPAAGPDAEGVDAYPGEDGDPPGDVAPFALADAAPGFALLLGGALISLEPPDGPSLLPDPIA